MISTATLEYLLSQDWFQFTAVALLGFLTGLELREYFSSKDKSFNIGSSRTYTFIAILGFVLTLLDPSFRLYLVGMLFLATLFGIFYYRKLQEGERGILQLLIGLIVYSYGPVMLNFPPWFSLLLFVAVVFTLNARPLVHRITEDIERNELLTLAKFLLLAGVVLPLLPDTALSTYVPASPFRIWVGVVVLSGISYAGYILKRYVFRRQGYYVTGLVGGLYSSTATTVVLARKAKTTPELQGQLMAAMLAASGIMYLRLLLLTALLKPSLLSHVALPLIVIGLIVIVVSAHMAKTSVTTAPAIVEHADANPLVLGVAALFALLFVAMLAVTQVVIQYLGPNGLELLSVVVGFMDIDPYVLSILNGQYDSIGMTHLAGAILIAAGVNDVLKGIYAVVFGERRSAIKVLIMLSVVGVITVGCGLVIARLG